ncbi:NADH:flavin oxidoreductase/NADH oxidase [Trichoderma asperelloides]|nr:NADH:flavin oxidoreductase/NADH oxidase [Trichoderma asperelloides]
MPRIAPRVAEAITLPSGLSLNNRLIKAAMAESMAVNGQPSDELINAYAEWAPGGWGALITGNVMVDERHLNSPDDVVATAGEGSLSSWTRWAKAMQANGAAGIVQISHPGRQSPIGAGARGLWAKTVAPSRVPLDLGPGIIACMARKLIFGTPRELEEKEIEDIVERFVSAAKLSHAAGFKGVELHAAHGYLLAQFLSPKTNLREDSYGGTVAKRAKIVVDIIKRIRADVPKPFCIALKINSTDYQGEAGISQMIEHLSLFEMAGIDFLELSGGTYEDPQDKPALSTRSAAREAFFLDAARSVRAQFPNILLLVTGGFRSRASMEDALASGACDLIGIGRPAAVATTLPNTVIFNENLEAAAANFKVGPAPVPRLLKMLPMSRIISGGAESKYFRHQIQRIGKGLLPIEPPLAG